MNSQFDRHARTYDEDLKQALSITGESRHFFAQRRVTFLAQCLQKLGEKPRFGVDYGCGTGDTTELLRQVLRLDSVTGLDVSRKSLEIARSSHKSPHCHFLDPGEYGPPDTNDLAYCNGVFHHILKAERPAALSYIRDCLRPGGVLALWENNPLNPGTRYVMSRCEFDRDAIPVASREARKLLLESGFQILSVNFLFLFPRFLRKLRVIEPYVSALPFGAQYQVLGRKR
ncbi:MAG TPA: class I SAM-dependent methyltransferase [Terriglobales bacterium]|nr:class I SAM-dependent methyltransferase [Terriglobales bacterium]